MIDQTLHALEAPLTASEFDTLVAYLCQPDLAPQVMGPAMVEGLFAALAIGPRLVLPSEWIPWVWDRTTGASVPAFADTDALGSVLNLLMRHYNAVHAGLSGATPDFVPLHERDARWRAEDFGAGFLAALQFDTDNWQRLLKVHPEWLAPLVYLGSGRAAPQGDAGAIWASAILPSVICIRDWWASEEAAAWVGTFVREQPKVGRNERCPCGSGRKYKKCCGVAPPSAT